MKVEILRAVMISGEPVSAGSFVEVSQADGNLLIGSHKAIAVDAKPVPVEVTEEPKPKRRAKAAVECTLPSED